MSSKTKSKSFLTVFYQNFKKLLSYFFIVLIKGYQYTLSPFIGRQCRYYPTCSNYSIEAFRKHGPFKGLYLTLKRVLSCHPWGGHGYDPVP
ncbi:MAG: membrane protein insertion efficiency factor YidD [Bacteroidota bacterium]|nr:membrane protein insertion efficiency factor YidD [Bacteroidota bacterium]